MDWTAPVDAYCERVGPAFWAEPLNAVSNAAFLIAAVAAWQLLRRRGGGDIPSLSLTLLVAAIGSGSFLFHTFANRWSALADVIPIAVFIHAYLFVALRRFFGLSVRAGLGIVIAFALASAGAGGILRAAFGSTGGYVPAFLAMAATGLALYRRNPQASRGLLMAACVFLPSMALRMADGPLCGCWPWGTHFLWHACNAATLYLLLRAAILADRPGRSGVSSQKC